MENNLAHVMRELQRYGNNLKLEGDKAWTCCPFHEEKTPSCKVNLKTGKYPIGSFYCFGCGESGGWNKLAERAGLDPISTKKKQLVVALSEQTDPLQSKLLFDKKKASKRKKDPTTKGMDDWRGISGKLLYALGAEYFVENNKKKLRLPVNVRGTTVTNINARLKKSTSGRFPSYVMDDDMSQSSKMFGLFPFDYVESLLKSRKTYLGKPAHYQAVALVEGPRDALNMIQNGMLALAILGTHNWGSRKARLAKMLSAKYGVHIVIMMDGDKAGREAQKKVRKTFDDMLYPYKKVNLSKWAKHYNLDKLDPMELPDDLMKRVRKLMVK